MKVKLIPWQVDVLNDEHRFKVICAGRRAGKSVLARMITLRWATEEPGLYWIVSPTYRQSKMIHWRDIQNEIPKEWIARKNEVELSLELKNGSVIELRGAENPDNLRGVKLRGLIVDEIASIRNWDWLWAEVLRPTLADYEAPAIFISTPKGFNHFYDLFNLGQSTNEHYKSWKYTSNDNPFIAKSEIEAAKSELTEDTFAQEYMADFRKFTGLVYKGFDRKIHVREKFEIPEDWEVYRGMDFGATNPTACLWIAVDKEENWFVVDEYYETGQTTDYHAGVINANPYSKRVVRSYGDPSAKQWMLDLQQRGVYITAADKETGTAHTNWVMHGIDKIGERLKPVPGHGVMGYALLPEGLPRLFIFEHCHSTIAEFETYRWKEKSVTQAQDLNEPDSPEKANDHALDALRYFAVSYSKKFTGTVKNQWSKKQWQIGR